MSAAEPIVYPTTEPVTLENPFPGLRPFQEGEEHLFFGRESQVDRMVDKLAASRFLAVVGTSGSGKSSLVNCGLKPALHRGVMASAGTSWCMVQMRPGGQPIRALARAFAASHEFFGEFKPSSMSLEQFIETTLDMSSLGIADLCRPARLSPGTNLLLVVDQFEELFRYSKTADTAGDNAASTITGGPVAFVNLLLEAQAQTKYPIYVVLTMRSDFLGECSQFDRLPEVINQGQYLVPRLTRDERRQAIAGPIGVAGAVLSPVLLPRLVNDVGENPDQLSILQHAINRTWAFWQTDAAGTGQLSLEHYENPRVGTMAQALDLHAEEAYAELTTPRERRICEKVFKALTDKGTDARGIRRPMKLHILCDICEASEPEVVAVLNVFRAPSRSFLMPPLAEIVEAATVIDISHEILMRVWMRLKEWADEDAQSSVMYRRLAETAELHASNKAGLWRDPELQNALEWRAREEPNAAWAALYRGGFEAAQSFLDSSKRVRDHEKSEAEFERRWRGVTPYLGGLIFVVFIIISPLLSRSLAPKVSGVMNGFFGTGTAASPLTSASAAVPGDSDSDIKVPKAADLKEFIADGVGFEVGAVICIAGFAGLWFAGRRAYRHFAFAAISAEVASESNNAAILQQLALAETGAAENTLPSWRPAGFWRILAAGLLDQIVYMLLIVAFYIFFLMVIFGMMPALQNFALICFLLSIPALQVLYPFLITWSRLNGTLGDLAFGIRLVDLAGNKPKFARILSRCTASFISLLLFGIGYLIEPLAPRRQSLPDRIAGTRYIRYRRKSRSTSTVISSTPASALSTDS